MFVSAGISLIVYTLVFFRLRGNLIAEGYRIKVLSVNSSRAWNLEAGRAVMESNTMSVAWQLMWYPVSYTFTVSNTLRTPTASLLLSRNFIRRFFQ
jgi:hypothetical protein